MMFWFSLFLIFSFGYILNMFYISVLYHRGLTHQAVFLRPWLVKWVELSGVWVTGLDPKTWTCMHRIHHEHSDTENDPHSPQHYGLWGVWLGQYKSYLNIQKELLNKNPKFLNIVKDIKMDLSFVTRHNLSWFPYILHIMIAVALSFVFDSVWYGSAYFFGIASHPLQGWLVNAFAHYQGPQYFKTGDKSTNNWWVGLFVFGEGYQNNHHYAPRSARFSYKWYEIDFGYTMCLVAEFLGLIKIDRVYLLNKRNHPPSR